MKKVKRLNDVRYPKTPEMERLLIATAENLGGGKLTVDGARSFLDAVWAEADLAGDDGEKWLLAEANFVRDLV